MGVVVDSLHDQQLSGAVVSLQQLPQRWARTTPAGAFRIDSVPPGRYTLVLSHPVIDSIGIRVLSDTIPVAAGETRTVELAIPSAGRLVAALCPPIKRRLGPGAIVGRVDNAVDGAPATGAEVSLAWVETEVSTTTGIRSAPRVRVDRVAPDGTYRICGIPVTLTATLQAQRGPAKTAEVPVETTEEPLIVRVLHLPPPPVAEGAAAGPAEPRPVAVVRGRVTNAGGVPVAGARVTVQGAAAGASTGADGTFTLSGVPPGTQAVLVRRVGYTPVQLPMDVSLTGPNNLTVRLGEYAPQLSRVEVKAKRVDPLEATGFTRREKSGLGRYMNEDQIAAIHPTYTTDILRRMPGLYVTGQGAGAGVYTTRGYGCVNYLVDRTPIRPSQGQTIDEIVNPQDVTAVEFYNQATAPLELSAGVNEGCALVVIWTKSSIKAPSR